MKTIYPHVPYFYIIKHIPSGKLYAGAKWGKYANPNNFMIKGGYTTSSRGKDSVNELIEKDGINSFEIILLITEFEPTMDAYSYETVFLQTWDIASKSNWINTHNNKLNSHCAYGSEKFYDKMINKYGVSHWCHSESAQEIKKKNSLELIGVEHFMQSVYHRERQSNLMLGYNWYNNGIDNIRIYKTEIPPINLIKGFLGNEQNSKNLNPYATKGMHWYYDPVTMKTGLHFPENIPIGWVKGRVDTTNVGRKWYHDPVTMKSGMFKLNIPYGWVKGRY